ncbi:MAG TPA: hypothetical protein DHW14_07275 [Clostridiales bacterium]|nr:hypothetical protein [Clostridiales bacterium]
MATICYRLDHPERLAHEVAVLVELPDDHPCSPFLFDRLTFPVEVVNLSDYAPAGRLRAVLRPMDLLCHDVISCSMGLVRGDNPARQPAPVCRVLGGNAWEILYG